MLILYLCFHHEPDIKSTSVPLSLFIFVACYLMIFFTILLAVRTKPGITLCGVPWFDDLMCTLLIWSSCIGLTILLVLATLIVKMLRVYCIFTHYKSKVSQAQKCNSSSNFVLAIYVILILFPNIFTQTLWTFVGNYRNQNFYDERADFIDARKYCISDNGILYNCFTYFSYQVLLSLYHIRQERFECCTSRIQRK